MLLGEFADPDIPAFAISKADGEYILQLLQNTSTFVAIDTVNLGDNAVVDGTSMSCPHVAGLIALMLANNPSLTRDVVETILFKLVL